MSIKAPKHELKKIVAFQYVWTSLKQKEKLCREHDKSMKNNVILEGPHLESSKPPLPSQKY